MENKHTKKLWLIPLLTAAVILLAGIILFFALELPQKLRGYDALKTFLEQPSFSAEVTLEAQVEGTPISASGCLHKLPVENKSVYALTTEGITLGYYDGTVYLENGKAYGLGTFASREISLPNHGWLLLPSIHIEGEDDHLYYQFHLSPEQTKELSPDLVAMSLVMETEGKKICSVHLSAAFSENHIALMLRPAESNGYTLPEAMENAIRSGIQPETEDLIGDILPLLSGFGSYFAQEIKETEITLSADCGPLDISDSFVLTSDTIDGIEISRLQRKDLTLYLTEGNVYTEDGRLLMDGEVETSGIVSPTQLLGLAYTLCLTGDFEVTRQTDSATYVFSLDEDGMKELSRVILPETSQLDVFFETGVLNLTLEAGTLENLSVMLSGNLDLFLLEVPVSISADLNFSAAPEEFTIPDALLDAIK